MLTELCKEINNYFDTNRVFGTFKIENGVMPVLEAFMQDGQYFRIVGSVFNDGVYQYPLTVKDGVGELKDEEFEGAVWAMAVPQEVIALADEIKNWCNKYQTVDSMAMSPYNSESFGGYSYSKSSGGSGDGSGNGSGTWQGVFANRLSNWRKIRP